MPFEASMRWNRAVHGNAGLCSTDWPVRSLLVGGIRRRCADRACLHTRIADD